MYCLVPGVQDSRWPHWGPVMHDSCSRRQSRWAHRGRATNQPASGLLTTQPASGLLTIGRRRRRRARSWTPSTRMLPGRRPGGPGTRGAGLEVITVRVHGSVRVPDDHIASDWSNRCNSALTLRAPKMSKIKNLKRSNFGQSVSLALGTGCLEQV